jgi:hypothetical protein
VNRLIPSFGPLVTTPPMPVTPCEKATYGFLNREGYVQVYVVRAGRESCSSAHKQVWERAHGPVPKGWTVDHLCRNRRCIRLDHLEAVSHRINTLRGNAASSINARKTHCKRGHPFDEKNTFIVRGPHGLKRGCRECRRTHQRRRAA